MPDILLTDITVSHNPRASRRGLLELFHSDGAAHHSEESRRAYVELIKNDHPEIEKLRQSILQHKMLQSPTVRAFRAKNGDHYVQRYGVVFGEGRILAHTLIEAETGTPVTVSVNVEDRMSVDTAFEHGLAENLDRNEMSPTDLAIAFHEMLTIRTNPATRSGQPLFSDKHPKGRPYTIKEIAERVRKSYWWVRDHEALFYLSDSDKNRCSKDWQDGKRNVTKFCKLALAAKAAATGEVQEVEPGLDNPNGRPENGETLKFPTEPSKRRRVLGVKAVEALFDATAPEKTERLSTLAEVLGLTLEEATAASKQRVESVKKSA